MGKLDLQGLFMRTFIHTAWFKVVQGNDDMHAQVSYKGWYLDFKMSSALNQLTVNRPMFSTNISWILPGHLVQT